VIFFLILILLGKVNTEFTSTGNLHLPIPMVFISYSLLKLLDLKSVSPSGLNIKHHFQVISRQLSMLTIFRTEEGGTITYTGG